MTSIVTINDALTMYGSNQQQDGVFQVGAQFFHSWYSTPESKVDIRERPVADGAFGIDHDWRTSLALPMNGRFRGASWMSMMRALQSELSTGATAKIAVEDDEGYTSREVSVRRFKPQPNPGALFCTFDADFVAFDYRRYGLEQVASTGLPTSGSGAPWPAVWPYDWGSGGDPGRVSVTNIGTTTTYPMLEVTGGLSTGVELVEVGVTGARLRLDLPIPDTSTVFFDTRRGRAYLDVPSNDVTGSLTRRDWWGWAIPPGGTRVTQFNAISGSSGSPLLSVRYSPAY